MPSLAPNITSTEARKTALEERIALLHEKSWYNAAAKFLPELDICTEVLLQNPDTKEQEQEKRPALRLLFYVKLTDRTMRWKNRRFLRQMLSEVNSGGGKGHEASSQ